jgi:hypothetical protein
MLKKYRQAGLSEHGEFGPENLAYKALRTHGIVDKLYKHRDRLRSQELSLVEMLDGIMSEGASGYIPSNAEKDDPRFKTALTVDVKPDTLKKSAKKLGSKISRAGIPPLLRP